MCETLLEPVSRRDVGVGLDVDTAIMSTSIVDDDGLSASQDILDRFNSLICGMKLTDQDYFKF